MDIEDPQIDLLRACREFGVGTIAYSPLGRGFLTGTIKSPEDLEEDDLRKYFPHFSEENFPKNLKLVDEITDFADVKCCTPGQLVLAFWMAQAEDIIPIPGTTKAKNFDENMGAFNAKITKEASEKIRKAIDAAEVQGGRYPEVVSKALFVTTVPLDEYRG